MKKKSHNKNIPHFYFKVKLAFTFFSPKQEAAPCSTHPIVCYFHINRQSQAGPSVS